jgi:glycosyltransferase involved in cell wall biosynthesis
MNLYRTIDRTKIQFDFVKHTAAKGDFEDEIQQLGGRVYSAPKYKGYNHLQYCKWWHSHFLNHPEHKIVHGHYFTISALYLFIAKQHGRITIAHGHNTCPEGGMISRTIKTLMLKPIKYIADYRLACGSAAGKWLYKDKAFCAVKNALDVTKFAYNEVIGEMVRNKLNIQPSTLVVGTVSNMSVVKNPKGLIDAFVELNRIHADCKLLWVGDGECRYEIETRIKNEGIEENVLLLGRRDDVPELLQAMNVFLLPSFSEGLPVSMIEAQAAGLKCFISDAVTREADITGRCEYLPLNQPELWADTIEHSDLSKVDTTQKIIDAGYDIQNTSKWLENFYQDIQKGLI